jgi:predicted enzyme related to lactoylglutathione lyase
MPTRVVHLAVDAADPAGLARFWADALGWKVADDPEGNEFCVLTPR